MAGLRYMTDMVAACKRLLAWNVVSYRSDPASLCGAYGIIDAVGAADQLITLIVRAAMHHECAMCMCTYVAYACTYVHTDVHT